MTNTSSSRLNVTANVALIIASVIISGVTIQRFLDGRARLPTPISSYRAGEKITLSGVDFSQSNGTLLLIVRSTCHFCTESIPFYRRLVQQRNRIQADVQIIAVSTEETEVTRSYLQQHNFMPDDIVRIDLAALRVSGTPTVIVTNQAGVVVAEKKGRLPSHEEASLLKVAFGQAPSSSSGSSE